MVIFRDVSFSRLDLNLRPSVLMANRCLGLLLTSVFFAAGFELTTFLFLWQTAVPDYC